MTFTQRIYNLVTHVFDAFEWIVRILMVFITLLISLQVFLRNVFNTSILWAEEVSLIVFIYITFFTMAIAIRYDLHLRVELFVSRLIKKGRMTVELFDNLVLLLISILMLYTGIKLTAYGVASIMPATRWPTSIIYLPTPIAGIMCCLHQIFRLAGVAHSDVADNYIRGSFQE